MSIVNTLNFTDSQKQFMADLAHFYGRSEMTRKEIQLYSTYIGKNYGPGIIVKNEACKSAKRGTYDLPVKRLHIESLAPSVKCVEICQLREANQLSTTVVKSEKPKKADKKATVKKADKKVKTAAPKTKKTKKNTEAAPETTTVVVPDVPDDLEARKARIRENLSDMVATNA